MSNISQHHAAEIWEIARDHNIAAAKINCLCREIQDTQLRSTLEQHARRFQQIGQQLTSSLQQSGAGSQASNGGFQQSQQFQPGGSTFQTSGMFNQSGQQSSQGQGFSSQSHQAGANPIDILAVGECLKDCKHMAVHCMIGATEASQPMRNTLYQIAGEHLRMAEEHYHWLEQRQLYASPKADQQATQQYQQALQQLAQVGQTLASQPQKQPQQQQQPASNFQHAGAFSQQQPQQQHQQPQYQQPALSGSQYGSDQSQIRQ